VGDGEEGQAGAGTGHGGEKEGGLGYVSMASDALRSQVAARWQESFARLNRHEPGIAGLVRLSQAWNVALALLRPRRLDEPKEDVDLDLVRSAFAVINAARRLPFLLETFLEELKKRYWMVGKDVDEYMARFEQTENAEVIRDLVLRLVAWFKHWAPLPECAIVFAPLCILTEQAQIRVDDILCVHPVLPNPPLLRCPSLIRHRLQGARCLHSIGVGIFNNKVFLSSPQRIRYR
jgi:hypothetical protein